MRPAGDRRFGDLHDAARAVRRRRRARARPRPRRRRHDDLQPGAGDPRRRQLYALSDYVTPNETEAGTLSGLPQVENLEEARAAGDFFLARGAKVALITLGKRGALFHAADRSVHVPSFPIAEVVDTTGAGDAFNGGFAAALAEGMEPLSAARFACAAAGLSVTRAGTAPAMPSREEIDRLLKAHP